ncbi:xanthine dehydrogenase family protein molybdopterin-binding subunit [Streptomyces albireticuli]|uniref:xanthine dehydrogenase family protein molybdopterin-binding subunit n=1 Tax=Streptomyces albireticuli TaxID=1940 RepID=UPI001E39C118|nr:xanthine dehydrogenase family protein molybdopterin-binding subunit [Streptomyces albireticuli]MCD9194617.1 xanthine dehydrogenase family protein molybdopterin-binding subunit [Streptomyces albireticuli]
MSPADRDGPTGPATPAGHPADGAPVRLEGLLKVTGAARYAAEHTPPGTAYAWPVPARVARGRVVAVDDGRAMAEPGALAVLTHENAPRLKETDDATLLVLQDDRVPHRGWYVALAVARTPEAARAMADAVVVSYEPEPHDAVLTPDHPGLYVPDVVNGGFPGSRERGDFDAAYAAAPVRVDATYTQTALHNHPMEPHASTARWEDGRLFVHDSSQGATTVRETLAGLFGVDKRLITVVSEHVGGGFGSKGTPRPQVVLAAMAARHTGLPVKLALPRAQLAAVVGHRPPVFQRVRLGAGEDGVIRALAHEVVTRSSAVREFVEQAAVPSRAMYTSPHSRTVHRAVALDVPGPSWMRAPGEASGMYALECAMDELACAAGLDPVELRIRNDTATEPDSGKPYSSRHLVECLREGARRFGWAGRDPRPRSRAEGRLLLGTGVAAAYYPVYLAPSRARARAERTADGVRFLVGTDATDIGTGARTVLAQIAAEALGVPLERVGIEIGSTDLPAASLAGGSSGTASWGWAVHKACRALGGLLAEHGGTVPPEGLATTADTADDVPAEPRHAKAAFGAHFAEAEVDADTGETRVRRLLGVYAAGRILNARTARSQFVGGMVMGLGMALLEGSTMDPRFGDFAERDLASYHVPACADVRDVEAHWIAEDDPHLNPVGGKGIGEIGIVGTAAAIANAVHHATGVRVRDLPITPDKLLGAAGGLSR